MYASREQHIFMDKMKQLRLFIRKQIVRILLQVSQARAWGTELLRLAVEIEKKLYNQASSEEDYMNKETLQKRVAAVFGHTIYIALKPQMATGNLPQSVALGEMNVMKSIASEVNNKHLNMPALQSKSETPVMNSLIPLHADPVLPISVNTWIDPAKSECRGNGMTYCAEDGWYYHGTLEDILHPPKKYLKLSSSDETSRPWNQNMHQPCHLYEMPSDHQQFGALHCNGGPSLQLTGFLEDITNHPLKNLKTPLSDLCDSDSFEFPQGELQLKPDFKYGCYVPPLFESRVVEPKILEKDTRVDGVPGGDSGKQKIICSLTEMFTLEQIEEHITGLRRWADQTKAKGARNGEMPNPMDESSCQVCTMGRLHFATSVYCSLCSLPIKHNGVYYVELDADMTYRVCITCHRNMRARGVTVNGHCIHKSKMEKIMNNQEIEEQWVGCDKCKGWQHQICALFNDKKNENEEAEYTCPECYMQEIKNGERVPLPHDAVPGAKDLPTTSLSEHIEKRLLASLKTEREERAKAMGKRIDEVPGAEDLVVRVVLSIEKKSKVKRGFLEVFEQQNYPKEFPYRSKVILLFQKIDGVEVCLFVMYVQEYGSQCAFPNQGCVYLSYLDSVRFFQPEVKTVNGEALRTFAYHEILIGYLDYCKSRGFRTCYVWACPPLKGDDYILYCHPEIQKAPTIGKLQKWYEAMLQKARKENVVVAVSDLYKHFFASHQSKSTATHLPYFDGDYWPCLAEEIINNMKLEDDEINIERKRKADISRRDLKGMRCFNLSENTLMDTLLMKKLGEIIFSKKDNFIVVHLQYFCTGCNQTILSGRQWSCDQCKDFRLFCEKCYLSEEALEVKHKHSSSKKIKHTFSQVEVKNITLGPDDNDEIIKNSLFEDRQEFLHFCRKNYYQHDTLRRAKHSSMMILHNLHNPMSAASHYEND